MSHVTEGIEVNQKADAGHHQKHHGGECVDLKRKIDLKGTGFDPGVNQIAENGRGG
jgi:hypothetical protein